METPTREEILQDTIKAISKQFGLSVMYRDYGGEQRKIDTVSTGLITLDQAMGGGFGRGMISELFGTFGSGKTTLALSTIAQFQKQGLTTAFVDAEHALNLEWARKIGVNTKDLAIAQPDTAEQALNAIMLLVRSGVVDLIVVDSTAALVPKAEIEGEIGDSHVGGQARLFSQFCKSVIGPLYKTRSHLMFISQKRAKISFGSMGGSQSTGGNAIKFYSSHRLDIRYLQKIERAGERVGNMIRVDCIKNRLATPYQTADIPLLFNEGFSPAEDLINQAVASKIIKKAGAWYSYGDIRLGQGVGNAAQLLRTDEKLYNTIFDVVKKELNDEPSSDTGREDELPTEP
jgi:recombination protein RecA